MFYSRW